MLPHKTLPAIAEIEVSVTGTPAAVASRIQDAFGQQKFKKPVQLHERRALSAGRIRDAGPLHPRRAAEVIFAVDPSGILRVRARDAQTGQEQCASLDLVGTQSPAEVDAARERFAALRR